MPVRAGKHAKAKISTAAAKTPFRAALMEPALSVMVVMMALFICESTAPTNQIATVASPG